MNSTSPRHFTCGATLLVALLSVGCDSGETEATWWKGEQKRIELSQEVALKQLRLGKASSKANGLEELNQVRSSTEREMARLEVLRGQRVNLREEIATMENDLVEFKEAAIHEARQKAVGKKFEMLKTPTGKSYEDAMVVSVTDGGVTIRHAEGSARLSYDDLDVSQRALFGLDGERAMVALETERHQAANYERWLDSRVATLQQEEQKDAAIAKIEARQARNERALASARNIRASNERALAQPARPFGSYGYSGYSVYRSYQTPRYRNYYYYSPRIYCQPSPCLSDMSTTERGERHRKEVP